jgi:hypothetical protein
MKWMIAHCFSAGVLGGYLSTIQITHKTQEFWIINGLAMVLVFTARIHEKMR